MKLCSVKSYCTHANSNQGNTSSATGTPKSSNAHQTTNNSASNSSTPQAQNSGQLSKPTSLKQTGAKSGLRRAAIGKINSFLRFYVSIIPCLTIQLNLLLEFDINELIIYVSGNEMKIIE